MSQQTAPPSPRQRFLRERQRKQNLTFAVTGLAMAGLSLVGLLVLTGILPIPGGEFSEEVRYAQAGDTPCPSTDARPVDPSTVTVQVLNTTSRQGIASAATQMLTAAGYAPLEAGNSMGEYPGTVEIDAGPNAVDQAYTVARFFPGAKVVLTESTDETVTVLLGTFYDGALDADRIQTVMASTAPLKGSESCLALDPEGPGSGEAGTSGPESAESGGEGQSGAEGSEADGSGAESAQ
ncbi:LytR C-terminal domain-containing protein [Actinomyces sp. B33]|uniref:LytR C-terminal domain-containing protein n=1 Tax=Actinomyces sp. B33 TaxID=2942131 RepID=UPI0023412732|nr:LytR C-terminal domain-containing protein [Actinomyces sp. B33]MDC4233414.1 LytR C-terminal domain-containing protein [Actinomyces sp. B33]